MKTILLFFALLLNQLVIAQHLLGTFSNESEQFVFKADSTVTFSMFESLRHQDVGFSIQGYGTFRVMNDLLIIQTQKYPDTLAVYAIENEYATVMAKDDFGQTIPFVSYAFYFEESKIGVGSTDFDGVIKYEATTVDSICLTNWFGQQIGFAVQPGYSYVAEFGSNPVIEKKTVIFKILELNDEILRLEFLDYDHYLPTYNPERLKKIVRRAKWQKTDIRNFEKRS